jgi:exonuclease III
MTAIIKIANLNVNGITNRTRVGMLTEYIRRHDLHILFLQEITYPEILTTPDYDIYYNIGSFMRGTAIVARNAIALMNMNKLPSGRPLALDYKGLFIVNIYARSKATKRTERESFYNAKYHNYCKPGMGNS